MAIEGSCGARRIATTDPANALQAVRAVALIAVGALVIAQPVTAVQVAATLAGVYIVYKGIEAILRLIYVPPKGPRGGGHGRSGAPAARRRARRLAVPAIAVLLVAGVVAAFLGGGGAVRRRRRSPRASATRPCATSPSTRWCCRPRTTRCPPP